MRLGNRLLWAGCVGAGIVMAATAAEAAVVMSISPDTPSTDILILNDATGTTENVQNRSVAQGGSEDRVATQTFPVTAGVGYVWQITGISFNISGLTSLGTPTLDLVIESFDNASDASPNAVVATRSVAFPGGTISNGRWVTITLSGDDVISLPAGQFGFRVELATEAAASNMNLNSVNSLYTGGLLIRGWRDADSTGAYTFGAQGVEDLRFALQGTEVEVPEPSSAAAALGVGGMLLAVRHRRSSNPDAAR